MTPIEFQQAFLDELHLRGVKAPVESEEIYYWLNAAQDQHVREHFKSIDQNVDLTDDVRTLRKTEKIPASYQGDNYLNFITDKADYPTDYLFFMGLRATVARNREELEYNVEPVVGQKRTPDEYTLRTSNVRISQQDDIYTLLQDPFNRTRWDRPLAVLHENVIKLYTDKTFAVQSVSLDYLRIPVRISRTVTSELPAFTHRDIARRAAILFTELSSTQRGERRPPPTPTQT